MAISTEEFIHATAEIKIQIWSYKIITNKEHIMNIKIDSKILHRLIMAELATHNGLQLSPELVNKLASDIVKSIDDYIFYCDPETHSI